MILTPKEKAKEIVYKMSWEGEGRDEECFIDFAKQCAIVAIDEMIAFREALFFNEGSMTHNYLLDVRQEIQNLK